jgi:hypothetical protein
MIHMSTTDFGPKGGLSVADYRQAASDAGAQDELWGWVSLAILSLAVAGVFALFVAFSRVPGIDSLIPWPSNFFHKGLVIHVVFSFVVWFLATFAALATLACFHIADGRAIRLAWAGRAGLIIVALSFPLLFIPAFMGHTEASLSNYIPAIDHPLYELGVGFLLVGVLLPVIRLAANLGQRRAPLDVLGFATVAGGFIYAVALFAMAFAWWRDSATLGTSYEDIFWGGGHMLQFLNTLLMLAGWSALAGLALKVDIFGRGLYRLAIVLLALSVLPTFYFYAGFEAFSSRQNAAFTTLQYALAPPVLLMVIGGIRGWARHLRALGRLPWNDPGFLCLVLSPLVFGIGGLLGLMVDGTDTRTPAHYHGVIAGVNLAFMGLFLAFFLPVLRRGTISGGAMRAQILLYSVGQVLSCIGLFWAGGYGAPRKTADAAVTLVDGAVIGMYLNGVGALVAVIGGVMFIWTVIAALARAPQDA